MRWTLLDAALETSKYHRHRRTCRRRGSSRRAARCCTRDVAQSGTFETNHLWLLEVSTRYCRRPHSYRLRCTRPPTRGSDCGDPPGLKRRRNRSACHRGLVSNWHRHLSSSTANVEFPSREHSNPLDRMPGTQLAATHDLPAKKSVSTDF